MQIKQYQSSERGKLEIRKYLGRCESFDDSFEVSATDARSSSSLGLSRESIGIRLSSKKQQRINWISELE